MLGVKFQKMIHAYISVILKHEELRIAIENKLEIVYEVGHVILPWWVT